MTESELQQFQTVMLNINIRHSQQHLLDPVTVISGFPEGREETPKGLPKRRTLNFVTVPVQSILK